MNTPTRNIYMQGFKVPFIFIFQVQFTFSIVQVIFVDMCFQFILVNTKMQYC